MPWCFGIFSIEMTVLMSTTGCAKRWVQVKLDPRLPGACTELYKTSIKLSAPMERHSVGGLLQQHPSPDRGIVRYSTRVSLFMGEGSQRRSGTQEAGIVLLAERSGPAEAILLS